MSTASNSTRQAGLAARLFPAGLAAAIVGIGLYFDHADSFAVAPQQQAAALHSELAREAASPDVRDIAHWAIATHDHGGLPFVVVDKSHARIYAFDPQGRLRGSAPVALDAGEPNALPAGRFVAEPLAGAGSAPAVVWANGPTRVAVSPAPVQDTGRLDAALRVTPEFWHECVETLRLQPSVAYVLPQTVPAAAVIGEAPEHPGNALPPTIVSALKGVAHEPTHARQGR